MDLGCNSAMSVEDCSCSGVNDSPSAEEIERGSAYENSVSGESSLKVSVQSPCSEVSTTESLVSEDTRHFISNANSSNDPVQPSTVSSSSHLANKSAISSDLIKLLSPDPERLANIQRTALWAENEWRKSVGWPLLSSD
jgi:hypothetical protein